MKSDIEGLAKNIKKKKIPKKRHKQYFVFIKYRVRYNEPNTKSNAQLTCRLTNKTAVP